MGKVIRIRPAIQLTEEQIDTLDIMRNRDETITCLIRRIVVQEVASYGNKSRDDKSK